VRPSRVVQWGTRAPSVSALTKEGAPSTTLHCLQPPPFSRRLPLPHYCHGGGHKTAQSMHRIPLHYYAFVRGELTGLPVWWGAHGEGVACELRGCTWRPSFPHPISPQPRGPAGTGRAARHTYTPFHVACSITGDAGPLPGLSMQLADLLTTVAVLSLPRRTATAGARRPLPGLRTVSFSIAFYHSHQSSHSRNQAPAAWSCAPVPPAAPCSPTP
jgi:hypothetical protein